MQMCHLSSPASSTGLETARQHIQSTLKQVTYGGWNTLEVSPLEHRDLSGYVDSINAERPKYHHIRGRCCDAARVGAVSHSLTLVFHWKSPALLMVSM